MTSHNHTIDISTIKKGTKVLFANIPADGHFHPLTGLAVHLKNMGCDVRWYTSKNYEAKVQSMDIGFYPLKAALDIASTGGDLDKLFPARSKCKGQISKLKFDMVEVFIKRAPEYFADIQEIYTDFEFEILIADITFTAIPLVKEVMKIPVIAVGVVTLPETSKDLPPSGLGLTPSNTGFGKLKQSVLRYLTSKLIFSAPSNVFHKILEAYNVKHQSLSIFDIQIKLSSVLLQTGTPGFEYKRSDLSSNVFFAGPLLPYTKQRPGRWYNDKLKRYDKVLLVTQGTIEKDVTKLLIPALEAFKNSNCLVIVTTGGSDTEKLRSQYQHDNVIIEDFIPFNDVLPYTDVYISNGGFGGVLLSIQNGIPMVVAGVHEGKNEINARVGYFKYGVNLKTETPSVQQLRKSVEDILKNEVYASNVKRLQSEFAVYNPGAICAREVARLLKAKQNTALQLPSEEVIY